MHGSLAGLALAMDIPAMRMRREEFQSEGRGVTAADIPKLTDC
jgi:hypothetical protein